MKKNKQRYNDNNLTKVMKRFEIISVKDVTCRLEIMLPEDREMFLAKWGLLDGKYCRTREDFEEKLGKGMFQYVDWIILKANTAFENAGRFLEIYAEESSYTEPFLRKAYCYADIFVKVCGRKIPETYTKIPATKMVEILETAMAELSKEERFIINELNGLTEDGSRKTYLELERLYPDTERKLSSDRVRKKEERALKQLKNFLENSGVI